MYRYMKITYISTIYRKKEERKECTCKSNPPLLIPILPYYLEIISYVYSCCITVPPPVGSAQEPDHRPDSKGRDLCLSCMYMYSCTLIH